MHCRFGSWVSNQILGEEMEMSHKRDDATFKHLGDVGCSKSFPSLWNDSGPRVLECHGESCKGSMAVQCHPSSQTPGTFVPLAPFRYATAFHIPLQFFFFLLDLGDIIYKNTMK